MKKFIVLVGCLFAFNALSAETKVCESVYPQHPGITLHIDLLGMFQKVVWENETLFEVDLNEQDHKLYLNVKNQLVNYPLALELQRQAIGTQQFHSVTATLNTTARSQNIWDRIGVTFEDQMDIISDDAAGVIHLEFKDIQGQSLGSAIMVGWGGIFKNCR